MAIIHPKATLTPSKLDLLEVWLPHQEWAEDTGSPTLIGSYRFDDPDGEVGLEALLVSSEIGTLHVPLTYRATPLPGAEAHLVGTLHHSILGTRFVYDGVYDPVWMTQLIKTVLTGSHEAALEMEVDGEIVGEREHSVQVMGTGTATTIPHGAHATVARLVGDHVGGSEFLMGTWATGRGTLAGVSV